jgi:hypothetical protein
VRRHSVQRPSSRGPRAPSRFKPRLQISQAVAEDINVGQGAAKTIALFAVPVEAHSWPSRGQARFVRGLLLCLALAIAALLSALPRIVYEHMRTAAEDMALAPTLAESEGLAALKSVGR